MAFLLVFGTLIWVGIIPAPFNVGFSSKVEPTATVPCPSDNAKPKDLATLTTRIYNSTSVSGQAGAVGQALSSLGVTVTETTNWNGKPLPESTRLIAGKKGIDGAYTLRAYFPGATIHFDANTNSDVIDVVIGKKFTETHIGPTDEEKSSSMEPIKNCTSVS